MTNKTESKRHSLKVYLAHPIATKGEFEDSKRVAEEIRNGTISEIGVVAGMNEKDSNDSHLHKGVPSASANHLVLGMIDRWGGFAGDEDAMLDILKEWKWKKDKGGVTEF